MRKVLSAAALFLLASSAYAATKATRLARLSTIICCIAMSSASAAKPNIVFILADDLGAGEIQWDPTNSNIAQQAADANATISTPSLYSMAQEGVRFTNYHSAAPVCSPARAAILTGHYPAEFGIRAVFDTPSGRGIPQGTPTIASLLKEQGGYRTAHFGKWHLGESFAINLPPNYGFDESLTPYRYGDKDGYLDTLFIHNTDLEGRSIIAPGEHSAKTITDKAIEFIEGAESDGTPYFLNMWYRSPHYPIDPPGNFPQVVGNGKTNTFSVWPQDWADVVADIPELAHLAELQNHSPTSEAKNRAMMAAQIAWMDYQIGRLIEAIDAADPSGNTLIIFTSDNGAPERSYTANSGTSPPTWTPNGALRGEKRDLFEGGILVPMIARWPAANLNEGTTNNALIVGYDFLPTFLAAAGITTVSGDDFVGVSFMDPLMDSGPLPARFQPLIWEQRNIDFFYSWWGYDLLTTLDDEQNLYAVIDYGFNRKLVSGRNPANNLFGPTQVTPHLFDLTYIDISQDGEADTLDLLPAEATTQAAMETDYRFWRQQVGRLPVEFNLASSTADTTGGCVDVETGEQFAELMHHDLISFREGDFSFQTQLELDSPPVATGAVIAEHPGSWKMSLFPTATPDSVLVKLDLQAKNADSERPGLPGDVVTLNGTFDCAAPCSANIAFTVLGIVFFESSARLYIDGETVDEFYGNGSAAPYFREVYATGTETVFLGNDSTGQSPIDGRLIDPRLFTLNLTPAEVVDVMSEQIAGTCEEGASCH